MSFIRQNTRGLIAFAALLFCSEAFACIGKVIPDQDLGKYSEIFQGEVSGVYLPDYESLRLQEIKNADGRMRFSDIPPSYSVRIIVTKTYAGRPKPLMKLETGGCGVRIPAPTTKGIFFIDKVTGNVIPIYESETSLYANIINKLENSRQ
ncbi:hypothetical protein RF679_03035 [Undibacterium cyanobacteriorum]|uniref:Lipoprotein n=1 Tax=Undibacterium cyanobacteriorum TaxID=3073561 RepID=A0ABY9RK00_9BURK|nr:hypothetical protein [Undibacterium sp. 20NA77.5]WMW81271.1 hypothetical protein RF679_03035 [Undibacterium sp. 20NA77.5]